MRYQKEIQTVTVITIQRCWRKYSAHLKQKFDAAQERRKAQHMLQSAAELLRYEPQVSTVCGDVRFDDSFPIKSLGRDNTVDQDNFDYEQELHEKNLKIFESTETFSAPKVYGLDFNTYKESELPEDVVELERKLKNVVSNYDRFNCIMDKRKVQ